MRPQSAVLRRAGIIAGVLLLLAGVGLWYYTQPSRLPAADLGSDEQAARPAAPRLSVVATGLDTPWALVFLPDRSMLLTERPGRLRRIDSRGQLNPAPVASIPDVRELGEGGLLGVEIHPDFESNRYLYLYYTYAASGDNTANRVVRYRYTDNQLSDRRVVVDAIPGAVNHNGGRIKFGPDGYLYIAAGDAAEPSLSQNRQSLAGKILRVDADGNAAPGNPLGGRVYSMGHRNPQGLAWDDQQRLWVTEHGSSAADELNLVRAGSNYGWPAIRGDQRASGLEPPVIHSGQSTWAPAGAAYHGGSVYFAGLRGRALYQAAINGESATLSTHLSSELGRLREAVTGPDGNLYLLTSNRDGRGIPAADDDRVLRVNPDRL